MHDLNEAFEEFFTSSNKDVLLLKGKWGAGKTYFWENNYSEYIYLDQRLKYYSSTSLYGKSSLDELQKDILFSMQSIDHSKKELKNKRFKALKITSAVPAIKEKLFEYTGDIFFGWIVDNLDHSIIVIDDIERISGKIEKKEFWGFVSKLKNSCNKIVIISNIDSETNKELINQQIEKNVDIEVEIIPNVRNLIDTLFSDQDYAPYRDKLFEIASDLKLDNIRSLIKLKSFCQYLIKISDKALEYFISDIAFYSLIKYRANDDLPLYENMPENIQLFYMLNEKLSETEKKFYNIASRYIKVENPLAKRCIKMLVEVGYIDNKSKKEVTDYLENLYKNKALRKEYDEAWDYYHNSFDNDTNIFAEKLHRGFIKNVHQLSIQSLSTVYRLLNELGYDEFANECLTEYFDNNKDQILANMKNPISSTRDFHSDVNEVRKRLDELKKKSSERRSIKEILNEITFSNGWNPRDTIDLASYEVDDYVKFLKETKSENLDAFIKRLLQFGNFKNPEKEMTTVAEKTKDALKTIASEGGLNRMRIEKKFGITPEDT